MLLLGSQYCSCLQPMLTCSSKGILSSNQHICRSHNSISSFFPATEVCYKQAKDTTLMVCHETILTSKCSLYYSWLHCVMIFLNIKTFKRSSIFKPNTSSPNMANLGFCGTLAMTNNNASFLSKQHKFQMKAGTLHSSQIIKICYKFHTKSGKSIKQSHLFHWLLTALSHEH